MEIVPGRRIRASTVAIAIAIVLAALDRVPLLAQAPPPSAAGKPWTVPRTPWGDPDLQGIYRNKPQPPGVLEVLQRILRPSEPALLIVDPPDGSIPPLTIEARRRELARAQARREWTLSDLLSRGPANSWEDRDLWERCITRGLPASMLPGPDDGAYQIVQAPGYLVIRYEIVREARVVSLDGRPHLEPGIRQYMGDARGRWVGDALVIETTNFTDATGYRGSSGSLRLVERVAPVDGETISWEVTLEDPSTWVRPWTFVMHLTSAGTQPLSEYACHEGNYSLRNILSAARAGEKASEEEPRK